MKKFFSSILCLMLVFLSACGEGPSSSQAGSGRIKDSWLAKIDSKDVKLDEVFLRKNIYLVMDCSGSMTESVGGKSKIQAAKEAINKFVGLLPADTNVGLLTFENSDVREKVPLGVENRQAILGAVNQTRAQGGTPLSSAVKLGYDKLREQATKQLGYGNYYLVVITDGEANAGYDPTSVVNEILDTSPVVIYTIGLNIGKGHSLNQPGRTEYRDAKNPKDLEAGLAEVAAESDKF